jgi:hypothetical protein
MAGFTIGNGHDQRRVAPGGDQLQQGAAGQDFVIGMGRDHDDARAGRDQRIQRDLRNCSQRSITRPVVRCRAGATNMT